MTTLSNKELSLYKICFEILDDLYFRYIEYDKQIRDTLDFSKLDNEDLNNLFEYTKSSITYFQIHEELEKREF